MAKNSNLAAAKRAKNVEFYTQLTDIEKELVHYKEQLRGKVIFCNCDDPTWSNFWRYFHLNFAHIGLKKLIATHFDPEKPTYKLEYEGGDDTDVEAGVKTELSQNGDFRSPECIELLKECDVVVTNPPFSLFREYVAQLMEYRKKSITIGNQNAITYKEIFPLIKDNQLWLGYRAGDMSFTVPSNSEPRATRFWIDESGTKWRSMGNICWYTNIDHIKRHEPLTLFRRYAENPNGYPQYDNYVVIECGRIADIPEDYNGVIGVPITFLDKYCPDQFEIIGMAEDNGRGFSGADSKWDGKNPHCVVNGKNLYKRIFVRLKVNAISILQRMMEYNKKSGNAQIYFDEYFAKQILISILGISDVQVDDKPDLRYTLNGKQIGVEVVNAIPNLYHIIQKYTRFSVEDSILYVESSLSAKQNEAIKKYFPIEEDGTRNISPHLYDSRIIGQDAVAIIRDVFDKKVIKSSSYAPMDELYLFVFCQPNAIFSVEALKNMAMHFYNQSDNANFSHVFVFTEWELYQIHNGQWKCFNCRECLQQIINASLNEIATIITNAGF